MRDVMNQLVDVFHPERLLQLGLATLLGGAIGLERELGGKPAGLRTNILICMGSALYTQLSISMVHGAADATRVAGQIVTGVGFIGAGTILHARGAVVGLTSAATIWAAAALGAPPVRSSSPRPLGSTPVCPAALERRGPIQI